ncbi:MAG TPA: hypothetical protein ENH84_03975 [Phycisphaerae bacterium]|nr:hypothetical protein [Phycisphaerae bacterium]
MTRNTGYILWLLLMAAWFASGCEDPPAVFDKIAFERVHTLMVLPLQSPQDPSVGPIASGMVIEELSLDRPKDWTVCDAPVLWRLAGEKVDQAGGLSDDEAIKIASFAGVDAILLGTATYTITITTDRKLPRNLQEKMKIGDFQQHFGQRSCATSINLRILSVAENRAIYSNTAQGNGGAESALLRKVVRNVLAPLRNLLQNRK